VKISRSKKILLFLSLFIAVSDGTFVLINYLATRDTLTETIEHAGLEHKRAFELSNEAVERTMAAMATYVAGDPRIQDTFYQGMAAVTREGGGSGGSEAAKFRAQLNQYVLPGWHQVTEDFKVRQLHFHMGPGSTSFLRVHKPSRFGDNMDKCRFTVVDVNDSLKPVTGFETGRVVSGIRGVVPVFATDPETGKKAHVGALEAGTSFSTILPGLSRSMHSGLAVLLTKEHVQKHVWPEMMDIAFADTNQVEGFYVEAFTGSAKQEVLHKNILQELLQNPGTILLDIEGQPHAVTGFHLRDFLASKDQSLPPTGLILIWTSAAEQVAAFHHDVWVNIFYALLGFAIVESLLILAIRFITTKLETTIAQRTKQLHNAQDKLVENARKVGMAEVATDVLHNVGNVLNSVNTKAGVLSRSLDESKTSSVGKVAELLVSQGSNLSAFMSDDPRGIKVPQYLSGLSKHLTQEQENNKSYVSSLLHHVEHITEIVNSQQKKCQGGGLMETVNLTELINKALEINATGIECSGIEITVETSDLPEVEIDRHRSLQILVNLVRNAVEAHAWYHTREPKIYITANKNDAGNLNLEISDNGPGIDPENITKIFGHGFTTKKSGLGFGLHGAANSATEMRGSLQAHSSGKGQGAEFTLELPYRPRSLDHVV